ncbi:hypothetical protein LTR70_003983 [Exophiala xenobiotica]|uniref:Uncharacterized protein n=1 Tax=Lithohypha guttulata TaxID=1690604 RepID=A0ABR0JYI0_9EURO|nr:hypothetical protein LTR24_008909 [Lithohypha guttulata]KAK5322136.1 hypothetical protein LTR70_003983 [Exophiala xenobiotica]
MFTLTSESRVGADQESQRDDLISKFTDFYLDADNVPFVSYDEQTHMFVLKSNDDLAIKTFAETFKSVLDYNQGILRKKDAFDILDEELIKPIKGTALPEIDDVGNILEHFGSGVDLIQIDAESDDDDSTENTSSGGVPSLYWSPKCGDISILSNETAAAVANLTDCMICKEPESRRVRLINGNIYVALEKLQRLEALLDKLASHRAGHASNVDANLLSLSSQIPGTGVRYVSTTRYPHLDRVIAQPPLEGYLEEAAIGEEYVWDQSERKHIRSENLPATSRDVHATPVRPSTIWTTFKLPTIGNPANAVPRTPSGGNSIASGDKKRSSIPAPSAEPSKFLPLQDQARMREWSRNVDSGADPAVPAEQPVEPEAEEDDELATRRVVEDSDSDVDLQIDAVPTTARLIASDSSEEDEVPRKAVATPTPVAIQQHRTPPTYLADRARRPLDRSDRDCDTTTLAPSSQSRRAAANIVGAGSFFAGIPRDDDKPEEALTAQRAGNTTANRNTPLARREPAARNRGRGFGYDGAADDDDKPNINISDDGTSRLTPMSYRSPEPPYMPSNDFDSAKYGAKRIRLPRPNQATGRASHVKLPTSPTGPREPGQPHRFPYQVAGFIETSATNNPVDSLPRPSIDRDSSRWNRGEMERAKHKDSNQLIDVDDKETKSRSILPPPGLTIHQRSNAISDDIAHILDGPLEEIQRPSLKPSWTAPTYPNEETSFSASSSSGSTRQMLFNYTPQTQLVKPNINSMQNDTLAHLQAMKNMQSMRASRAATARHPTERIQEEGEVETRKYHNTMNLKGPNPGNAKKSKASAQESAAQRAERIAATMADAYGPVPKAKPANHSKTASSRSNLEPPSRKVQQLAKSNPIMAATHSDILQCNARKDVTDILVNRMRPMFEAARAFPGELDFEVQIGTILVMPSSQIKENKVCEPDRWQKIFNGSGISPDVKFNNIVTCDGSDIDSILEMKLRGNKALKAWEKGTPGPSRMDFEFQCQDNTGRAFKLRFNIDGTYSIHPGYCTVGKVGIQCPGRTWDVCAVLGGISKWHDLSDDLESAVKDLVSSIHVDAKEAMAVHFRVPASNVLTVHDVIVHRVSLHNWQSPKQEGVQLKVVESKSLYTRSHRVDKRLYFSFEKSHGNMAENHRVHYEVSVVDKAVADAFEANKQLELGELTSAETTGASLLSAKRANIVLDAALSLVDKIDWAGKRNYGTLVRRGDERLAREQELSRIMPPATHTTIARPVQLNTGHSVAGPRTAIASRTNVGSRFPAPTPTALPIHGIRAGTHAQVYEDASGNLFRIGQGGAKIPVVREDELGVGSAEILPNDSSSQSGRRPRVPQSTIHTDKPAGFW